MKQRITISNPFIRYLGYFFLFVVLYCGALWFIFPGYLSPFVPHHTDILDYPYDFAGGGYSLASRPMGLILTYIFGLVGGRYGIIVSAFCCISMAMILIIDILARETGKVQSVFGVLVYGILVFTAPTFYINYSFDIYGTYALILGLCGVWITYLPCKKPFWKYIIFAACTLGSFLCKETYIVSICFFLFVKLLGSKRGQCLEYFIFEFVACLNGIVSLFYGKIAGSAFTSATANDATSPYYSSFAPKSLLRVFSYYAGGLLTTAAVVLVFVLIILFLQNKKKSMVTSLALCFSGLLAYLPYCVLPNKLVPHYVFVAVPFVYAAILLIDVVGSRKKKCWRMFLIASICAINILSYQNPAALYGYEAMSGWTRCEKDMKLTLESFDEMKESIQTGEHVLVLGVEDTIETAYRPLFFVQKTLGSEIYFDVLCNYPEYCGQTSATVQYISEIESMDGYDAVICYSDTEYQIVRKQDFIGEDNELIIYSVYPEKIILSEQTNPDGSINLGVVSSDLENRIGIIVNGALLSTTHGETFISTVVPEEMLRSGILEVKVVNRWTGNESEPVIVSVEP